MLTLKHPLIELKTELYNNNANFYSLIKLLRQLDKGYIANTYRKKKTHHFKKFFIDIEHKNIICFDNYFTYLSLSKKESQLNFDLAEVLYIRTPIELINFSIDFISLNKEVDNCGNWTKYQLRKEEEKQKTNLEIDSMLKLLSGIKQQDFNSNLNAIDSLDNFKDLDDSTLESFSCSLCGSDSIDNCLLSDPQNCPH